MTLVNHQKLISSCGKADNSCSLANCSIFSLLITTFYINVIKLKYHTHLENVKDDLRATLLDTDPGLNILCSRMEAYPCH
jgi:hypothetical protein